MQKRLSQATTMLSSLLNAVQLHHLTVEVVRENESQWALHARLTLKEITF